MSQENEFPRGIEVVSGPFIINEQHRLLLNRSPKWNCWIVPGGHVNPGETSKDAAIRETKEELGVDIEIIDLLNVSEGIATPPTFKRNAHFIFFNYVAKLKSGEMHFNEEISEARWFDLEEVIDNPEIKASCQEGALLLREWLKTHSI